MAWFLCSASVARPQAVETSTLIDACEDTAAWKTFQSAGVIVHEMTESGVSGRALRFDIEFTKGSGYGGVIHNCDLPLPENYEITFLMRASVPVNNFEFKVSDDSAGEDIWWVNTRNFNYPRMWKSMAVKKRHLSFAWGPHPSTKPDRLRRIELVVTAGSGGKGSVWIDDVRLVEIPPVPKIPPKRVVTASSEQSPATTASNLATGKQRGWISKSPKNEWLQVDYGYRKEFGAVVLSWGKEMDGLNFDMLGSTDGVTFDTLHSVREGTGGEVLLYTPESEARVVRMYLHWNRAKRPFHLLKLGLVPSDSISTVNQYLSAIAHQAHVGWFPKYFVGKSSFWTIVGAASDEKEALFNEDGIVEAEKVRFSLEPFIRLNGGELLSWANAKESASLTDDYLPIPTVRREYSGVALTVTALADGEAGRSVLMLRYDLRNTSQTKQSGHLFLAVRPFQVNPTYQWLNNEGGFAKTPSISVGSNRAVVGDKTIIVSGNPDQAGVSAIDRGDIITYITKGKLPTPTGIEDSKGMASGGFRFPFDLAPDDSLVVLAAIPFWSDADKWASKTLTAEDFKAAMARTETGWKKKLGTVQFDLPHEASAMLNTVRSNLAYILINKDGPGFQPGSRSYERSWIRDGAMISSALMKFGIDDDVRDFVRWYGGYQYENGMVPCVVDSRGPDPVPENDSHGEFIFNCMEYFRFTNDTAFLRTEWPRIGKAVEYIQKLRSQRMTAEYRSSQGGKEAFYGLVPESISHEGYSAKPMHSYWDDFFTLEGLKDAAAAAAVLGERERYRTLDSTAKAFREDLYRSISRSMQSHFITYIPGCAELGDFDPTSTSISLFPCGELQYLPRVPLTETFDRYFDWFEDRKIGRIGWDAFTPYEIRNVGTYIYTGQKARANELMDWFMQFRRPSAWNGWGEVVWHDPTTTKFIGDMPHSWVGSDFINAFRAMFAYEIDDEPSLVVGGGIRDRWVIEGVAVRDLPTHYGKLSFSIKTQNFSIVDVHLEGSINASKSPIKIPVTLLSRPLRAVSENGKAVAPDQGYIRVRSLPATIRLEY